MRTRFFRLINAESITYRPVHDPKKQVTVLKGQIVKAHTPFEVDYFEGQPNRFAECTSDGTLYDRPAAVFGHKVRPIAVFKYRPGKEPQYVAQVNGGRSERPFVLDPAADDE